MDSLHPLPAHVKTCGRCRQTKPLTEFWRDARSRDGFRVACAACAAERRLARYDRARPAGVLITAAQVAAILRVGRDSVLKLASVHKIPSPVFHYGPHGTALWDKAALLAVLSALEPAVAEPPVPCERCGGPMWVYCDPAGEEWYCPGCDRCGYLVEGGDR